MATDATGAVTSPDNIPTYNTANDAPSGKGLNAIVAAIQTALSARITKPGSLTVGDVPVWNGTTFVRPTGTASLSAFLRGDGAWAGAYTDYVPAWTASGVAPAYGNAVIIARYLQIGKMVHSFGRIIFGSTSTFGTGQYSFGLPVTGSANNTTLGTGMMYDNSAGFVGHGIAYASGTTTMGIHYGATYLGADTVAGAAAPWAWAQSDQWSWNIVYEAA